jgi:hypothetical protein
MTMCIFNGILCSVTATSTGFILTKVPSIETFDSKKSTEKAVTAPIKEPVKKGNEKAIKIGSLGKSVPAPIENAKEAVIKPKKTAKKTDVVQTQKVSNAVKNGNYMIKYNSKTKLLEVSCFGQTVGYKKTINPQTFTQDYLKTFESIFDKLGTHQDSTIMSLSLKSEKQLGLFTYCIHVANKA